MAVELERCAAALSHRTGWNRAETLSLTPRQLIRNLRHVAPNR